MNITIVSGSPRPNSVTVRVARYLQNELDKQYPGHHIRLVDVRSWPLGMLENVWGSPAETPEEFRPLTEIMFTTQAFIIVTPEYNGSYTPAMKNLFDHFPKQSRKVFGLVTASPGAMGGMRAAMQLQQMVAAFFGILSPHMLITPAVDKKFNENAELIEENFQRMVNNFLHEFMWLAEQVNLEVPA